ncbi:MAG: NAD(P)/FAD-dependent oxidoreductase [Promethearchaeota archaeon]
MENITNNKAYDVIIIGAGPSGMTAAIYTARAGLSTLVIDESPAGGQVKTTHMVANYPGYIEPIPGWELVNRMRKQAERYGAEFELVVDITGFCLKNQEKWIEVDDESRYTTEFVLIAVGSAPRPLGIPGEKEFKGDGISYCATCDGEFYKDKDVFVIGGGNSAIEESLLLLKQVKSLTIIHQFDELQAEKISADKVLSDPKVTVFWSHEPRAFIRNGDKLIVEMENLKTHEKITETRDGIFVFIGMIPNSKFLQNRQLELKLNKWGYIPTNDVMETNVKGVYAAGDIRDKSYRQITTAVADGTIAALQIIRNS